MKHLITKLITIATIVVAMSSGAMAQQAKEEYFLDTLWTVEVPNFGDKLTAKYPTEAYLSDDRTKIYFNANGPYVMDIATGIYTRLLMLGCNTLHPNTKEFFHSDLYSIFTLPEGNVKKKINERIETVKYSPNGKYLVGVGPGKYYNEFFVYETENYTLLMKDTLFDISLFYGEGIYFSPSGNIAMLSSTAYDEKNPNGNWYHHIIDIEKKEIVKLNHRDFDVYQILDSNRFAYSYGRNLPANGIYNYINKKVDFVIPILFDEKIYQFSGFTFNNNNIWTIAFSEKNEFQNDLVFKQSYFDKNYKVYKLEPSTTIKENSIIELNNDSIFSIYYMKKSEGKNHTPHWAVLRPQVRTSIENEESKSNIYPNPTNELVEIKGLPKNSNLQMSISTVNGNLISQEKITTLEDEFIFSVRTLPKGAYFVRFYNNNFSNVYKVIKGE
jgi:hypothetical protein